MGFFGKVFDKVQEIGKKAFDTIKKETPGVFQGVKKALTVGRDVVKVGRKIVERLRTIPMLSSVADQILANPYAQAVEAGLGTAVEGAQILEDNVPYLKGERGDNPRENARMRARFDFGPPPPYSP